MGFSIAMLNIQMVQSLEVQALTRTSSACAVLLSTHHETEVQRCQSGAVVKCDVNLGEHQSS